MDYSIWMCGFCIFFSRIFDVALGTLRTIATIQGRTLIAFLLGISEITIWISVISSVIKNLDHSPVLGFFYALGFATGNVVGIIVERKLAFGFVILRVFTKLSGQSMAESVRAQGQVVTTFSGEGMTGPVTELCIVCPRRNIAWILPLIKEADKNAFYVIEHAREVRTPVLSLDVPASGWRAILKKK